MQRHQRLGGAGLPSRRTPRAARRCQAKQDPVAADDPVNDSISAPVWDRAEHVDADGADGDPSPGSAAGRRARPPIPTGTLTQKIQCHGEQPVQHAAEQHAHGAAARHHTKPKKPIARPLGRVGEEAHDQERATADTAAAAEALDRAADDEQLGGGCEPARDGRGRERHTTR